MDSGPDTIAAALTETENVHAAALSEFDERYNTEHPDEIWERYYARGLIERFGSTGAEVR